MRPAIKYKSFRNPRELGGFLLAEIDRFRFRTVSFDVFDTLIHRRVHPDAVMWAVSRWLTSCFSSRGIPVTIDCNEARHRAYGQLISLKAAQGLDLDVSLDELVLPWVRTCVGGPFDGDDLIALELAEVECNYEIKSCFCSPDFLHLAKELKKRGARVVYTSDMYLGAKYVGRILDACGYSGLFDAAYVSGDFALLKRTGRLFEAVLTAECVNPHDLFHIGDSVQSDGLRAAEKGIQALVHIDARMVRRHRRMEYDFRRAKVDPAWMGVLAAQYAEAGLEELGAPEEAYGRRVLGPIYASFIHRILERCKQEGIDKVYFMAREGYVLKILFDQFAQQVFDVDEKVPESIYLGISRLTTFLAAMRSYSLREITASFNNTPHYSIRLLFAPLRIDNCLLASIASKHGFVDIDAPLPPFFMKWPPFFRILEDKELNEIVNAKSISMRNLLVRHLEGLGFFNSSRVAVVDVGWSGQIQDNLCAAVNHRSDCPQIFGFYLGTTLSAHWRKTPENWMEWTHADQSHVGWVGRSVFEFVQCLEAVVRSPHGTVIGYDHNHTGVVPIFKPDDDHSRRAESKDDPVIALFQRGIREYGRLYSQAMSMFGFTASNALPYARMMIDRMVRFPDQEEAKWFLKISNVSDLGSSEVFTLGAHERLSILRPSKLRAAIRRSFWKYGIIALTEKRSLQMLFAGFSAIWSIPPKLTSLDAGIVFNRYASRAAKEIAPLDICTTHQDLLDAIEKSHLRQLELGRKQARVKNLSELTAPLGLDEVLRSYLAFRLARLICFVTKRHIPYQDGLSVKGWLARSVSQSIWTKRIYQALRRK
jgi:predicted HAD superfamily hydrolase